MSIRLHLKNVYRSLGAPPTAEFERHIVPHTVIWTHVAPVDRIQAGDRLTVRTNCPGRLAWTVGDQTARQAELLPVGGVMAGVNRYQLKIGPFLDEETEVSFTFECAHMGCPGTFVCCERRPCRVRIEAPRPIPPGY